MRLRALPRWVTFLFTLKELPGTVPLVFKEAFWDLKCCILKGRLILDDIE